MSIIEGGDFFDFDPDRSLVSIDNSDGKSHCEGCYKEIEPGSVVLCGPTGGFMCCNEACLRRYQENYARNYPFDPIGRDYVKWAWAMPRGLLLILAGHHRPTTEDRYHFGQLVSL